MQVAILGPPAVRRADGSIVAISGARLHALLSRLAVDAGRSVPAAALVDAVWGDEPPAEAANALQTLVSRLRRAIGDPSAIVADGTGYRLAVERDDVDAHRFARLAAEGAAALRAGHAEQAAALLRDALATWRAAEPTADDATATRLSHQRANAVRDRIEADLTMGRAAEVVAELESLAADEPLDERVAALLIQALAASGRQADALAVFERVRSRLAEELGVDPSAELKETHLAVLRGASQPQAARTNLRTALTSFIGRDPDVARLRDALTQHRLVTLVGPGGAGKTRLAGEVAGGLVGRFPDGVWFAELAPVTDPADLPQAVLGALARREAHLLDRRTQQSPRDTLGQLLDRLGERTALVVLDNCEHLIEAAAQLADTLLGACPGLRMLATSREPLAITGEVLLPVVPLAETEAVRLFAERAAAVRPGFAVDESTSPDVVEIVRRLDGLPLAIELAAARLRTLSLPEVTARIDDRFRLLTGGSRTALPRHRTLRAVVEWSWDLLTPAERLLAERLAVFPGGATAGTASAICADGDVPAADVADLLASLVDKSLLAPVAGGERLRMLETIREFGVDRLAERGDLEGARDRHGDYFARLVADAQGPLRGAGQLPWMRLLEAERENLVAALRHLSDRQPRVPAVELAVGLGWYWMITGANAEAANWLTYALAGADGVPDDLELLARSMLTIAAAGASFSELDTDMEDGLTQLSTLHARLAVADIRRYPMLALMRAVVAMFAQDSTGMQRAVRDAIELDDPWIAAAALMFQATIAENDGDIDTLRSASTAARKQFEVLGERWGLASSLQVVGLVQTLDGDVGGAAETYREGLRLVSELGAHDDAVWLQVRLADVEARLGNIDEARRLLELSQQLGGNTAPRERIFGGMALAEFERRHGDPERASRLSAAVMTRLDTMPPAHPMAAHGVAVARALVAKHELLGGGDPARAARTLAIAYTAAIETRDMPIVAVVGVVAAMLAADLGSPELAATRLGAAARLRGGTDPTQPDIAELTARLRGELGDAGFQAAFEAGRGLDREAAIAALRVE